MKIFCGYSIFISLFVTIFCLFANSVNDNNKASKTGYNYFPNYHEQFNHENKYSINDYQNQGPIFSGYWGWGNQDNGKSDPFEAIKLIKQSEITNVDFNSVTALGGRNNQTPWGGGRGQNIANCFLDQIQEVKSLGGSVTLCFGAAGINDQFFATAGDSNSTYLAYVKLHDLLLGYNINSVDFDLEGSTWNYFFHSPRSINNFTPLMWILKKIKADFVKIGENFHVRITDGGSPKDEAINILKLLNTAVGPNSWIYNDMSGTSIDLNNNNYNSNDSNWLEDAMKNENDLADLENIFKDTPIWKEHYSQKDTKFFYHHLGFTNNFHRQSHTIPENKAAAQWASKVGLGLIAAWNILSDHKQNSKLDPNHYGDKHNLDDHSHVNDISDFDITNTIVSNYENYGYWNEKKDDSNVKPGEIKNFHCYSKSQKDIILKWNYDKNVSYYDVKELQKNVVIKHIRVIKNTAGFYYVDKSESHYDSDDSAVGEHSFTITPVYVNSKETHVYGKTTNLSKNCTVKENDFSSDVQYFDANIFYPSNEFQYHTSSNDSPSTSKSDHSKPDNTDVTGGENHPLVKTTPSVEYVYFNGSVYQDIDTKDWGFGICKDFWHAKDQDKKHYLWDYNSTNGEMTAKFQSLPTPDKDSTHWKLNDNNKIPLANLTNEETKDFKNFTYANNSFLNPESDYRWKTIKTTVGGDTSKLISPASYQSNSDTNNKKSNIIIILIIVIGGCIFISIVSYIFYKKYKTKFKKYIKH